MSHFFNIDIRLVEAVEHDYRRRTVSIKLVDESNRVGKIVSQFHDDRNIDRFLDVAQDIDIEKMAQSAGSVFSTDADLSKSLRWIGIASAAVGKLDYAASGGIHAPEGVVKAILAGASAVEICSVLYQNSYAIIDEYVRFLNLWMDRKGMENINQFKGMLNVSDLNGVNTFERTQFLKYFSSRK